MKYWILTIDEVEEVEGGEGAKKVDLIYSQRIRDEKLCWQVANLLNPPRKHRKRERKEGA